MTANFVDMPRLYKFGTCIGRETVKEKLVEDILTLRGYGGKWERVYVYC